MSAESKEAIALLEDAFRIYEEKKYASMGAVFDLLQSVVNRFEFDSHYLVVLTVQEVRDIIFDAVKNRPLGGWDEEEYKHATYYLCEHSILNARTKTLEKNPLRFDSSLKAGL